VTALLGRRLARAAKAVIIVSLIVSKLSQEVS
jgi:hypothetical protein